MTAGSAMGRSSMRKGRFPAPQNKPRTSVSGVSSRMLGIAGTRGDSGNKGDSSWSIHQPSIATRIPRKRSAREASCTRGALLPAKAAPPDQDGLGSDAPLHVAEHGLEALPLPPALAQWVDRLPQDLLAVLDRIEQEEGGRAWLVGGCVRDCLSGLTPWEVDMATTLHADQVLALFPRALDTGSEHGTVTVRNGGISAEVTTLRAYSDLMALGGRPEAIKFGTSLKDDLALRDLTMNALAVHVGTRQLFDPWGGQKDISSSVLRAVGSARERLREDGVRALRVYRFMDSRVGVREPDEELSRELRAAPGLLTRVSGERLWGELRRIMAAPRAAMVCSRMARDQVLRAIIHRDVTAESRGVKALQLLPPQHLPLWASQASMAAGQRECLRL